MEIGCTGRRVDGKTKEARDIARGVGEDQELQTDAAPTGRNTDETASGKKAKWRHSILHRGDNIA